MKDLHLISLENQEYIAEDYHGFSEKPKALARSVEEASDVITRGLVATVTSTFPTHEVAIYFRSPIKST